MKDYGDRKGGTKVSHSHSSLTNNANGAGCQSNTDDEKKRTRRVRQRATKKVVDLKFGIKSNHSPEKAANEKTTTKNNDRKDDYWFYDPASDGYYYEQNGCRGWRKRPVGFSRAGEGPLVSDQEAMADFIREQSFFNPYAFVDPMIDYFMPQIRYYDPESDGYYFEMASVDGWRKRQPGNGSHNFMNYSDLSKYRTPSSFGFNNMFNGALETIPTSYGAALARGELPPACRMSDDLLLQDPISSGTSSVSSFSEDTTSPPLNASSSSEQAPVLMEDVLSDLFIDHYDRTLKFDETNSEQQGDNFSNQTKEHSTDNPFCHLQKSSYANTAATSCENNNEDRENKPPYLDSSLKRPAMLGIDVPFDEELTFSSTDVDKKKGRELSTNFNADKFIADLELCGTNTERVLRDLAALKTPGAVPSSCSADSPCTPAILKAHPSWIQFNSAYEIPRKYEDALFNLDSSYIEDIWSSNTSGKSKLSLWRTPGACSMVTCDNN